MACSNFLRSLIVCFSLIFLTACLPQGFEEPQSISDTETSDSPAAVAKQSPPPTSKAGNLSTVNSQPAQAPAKSFYAYTNGIKCASLPDALGKKESEDRILLIIAGFMTGINYSKGVDRPLDLKSMLMVTENYCRTNTDKTFTQALVFLDASLQSSRANPPVANTGAQVVPKSPVPVPVSAPTAAKVPATAAKVPATETKVTVPATKAPVAESLVSPVKALPAVTIGGDYVVQVYSTNSDVEAGRVIETLRSERFVARMEKADLGSRGIWYRVVVGPYADVNLAETAAEELRKKKFQTIVRQR